MNPYDKIERDKKCICNPVIIGMTGPTGPQGLIGPTGPQGERWETPSSSTEGIFFASYNDTNDIEAMIINETWLVSESSEYFIVPNNTEVEVVPGIYEIDLSGYIDGVDNTHGGSFYLVDSTGAAVKDLTFELPLGDISKMYFSKNILFRFEEDTILEVMTNLTGDINTSNIELKDVTLLMKKIYE